ESPAEPGISVGGKFMSQDEFRFGQVVLLPPVSLCESESLRAHRAHAHGGRDVRVSADAGRDPRRREMTSIWSSKRFADLARKRSSAMRVFMLGWEFPP